jgi:hypothetical protein
VTATPADWRVVTDEARERCQKLGLDPDEAVLWLNDHGCGYSSWGAAYGPIYGGTIPCCGQRPVAELAVEGGNGWFPVCAEHRDYKPRNGKVVISRPSTWPVSTEDAEAVADLASIESAERAGEITTAGWMAGVADALRWGAGVEATEQMASLVRAALEDVKIDGGATCETTP